MSIFTEPVSRFSLERMLTDKRAFGLTDATPCQRAICRAAYGEPLRELAFDPDVIQIFGGAQAIARLPRVKPRRFVYLAGVRGAKSMTAGAAAVCASQNCDLSILTAGEVPRVSVLSVNRDSAGATFSHIRGHVEGAEELRALLIGKPTTDALFLRHPSGRPVEVKVVAGGRAAGTLVSRWSAGLIADEAPRMLGEDEGVSNLDHAISAIRFRLLPGAQIFLPGSPWAPFGPVFDMVEERFGDPGEDIVVVRATGPQLNPKWWTPELCEKLRRENPDDYAVDVLCQFKAPGATMLDLAEIRECVMFEGPIEPNPLWSYVAVMDPATRGNAWALVLLANPGGGRAAVVMTRQWIGHSSRPLSPRAVLQEIAALLSPYGVTTVDSDQWSADALKDLAISCGLYLRTHTVGGPERVENFERVRAYVTDRRLGMCAGDTEMVRDLSSVRKRVTQNGIAIDLPITADGRHADFAAALALGLAQNLPEPTALPPEPTERDYADARKAELQQRIAATVKRKGMVMPP